MKIFCWLGMLMLVLGCSQRNDVVQEWRGTNRTGIYNESNLLTKWPDGGPDLLWGIENIGAGYGSPVVLHDRILVMGTQDTMSMLFALDLDGHVIYSAELGAEWSVNFPGSRSTPTILNDLAYVLTGKGMLVCLDVNNGHIEWKTDIVETYQGEVPRFGYAQSLVVDQDKVYCCPGGSSNNVVALNRFDGSLIWSCEGKGERPGYNPARLIQLGSRNMFITFSAYHLLAIDANTGELLWVHEQVNTPLADRGPGVGDTHANTILFENNIIYYIAGDGNCAVALQLEKDGSAYTQIWNNAVVDNFMGGIILHDKFIYSCNYSANSLVKIDALNGAVVESLDTGRGALIMADDMLYYYTMTGDVCLINIHGEKMERISSFKIERGSQEHFAHPVIHDGVLYIRHGNYLGAYSILK